jgi:Zn-dependent protease with chaperone function
MEGLTLALAGPNVCARLEERMDPLTAARATLPWWVGWGGMLCLVPLAFALGLGLAALVTWVAAIPLRHARPSHWVERARLIHPVRIAQAVGLVMIPTFLWGLSTGAIGPLSLPSASAVSIGLGAASLCAALLVRSHTEARYRAERVPWTARLRHALGAALVLMPHLIVALALALALPRHWDATTVAMLAVGALLLLVTPLGGGLWLARRLGVAHPASPRLAKAVDAAAERAGRRPRGVDEIEIGRAGAFALPLAQRLLFTVPAVRTLADEELEAIALHELGHLSESRWVLCARLSALLALLGLSLGPLLVVTAGWWIYATLLLAVVLVLRLVRVLARRMEEQADRLAHRHQPDHGVYARALEKLYSTNLVPAVMPGKRQLHPHLYDRLVSAGVQPSYPRPAPPPRWPVVASLGSLVLGTALGYVAVEAGPGAMLRLGASNEPWQLVGAALDGGYGGELGQLAWIRRGQGQLEEAAVLFRAQSTLGPWPASYLAAASSALAEADRCAEASADLEAAQSLLGAPRPPAGELDDGTLPDPGPEAVASARADVAACETRAGAR